MTQKLCIYHGNCLDGFTAAWIVRKALGDIEFFAGYYQNPPPDVTDKDVYIVDFSYKRPVMEELAKKANKIIHIDHHASAIIDMQGFDAIEKYYSEDNSASGAMLCWRYFFPETEPIDLVKSVDDRDRWAFKIPGTREVQASIFSYEYTFENWDMLASLPITQLENEGKAIDRKHFKDIKELVGAMTRRMNIAGYNVPVINVPYTLGSDAGNILAKNEPFSAYYYEKKDRVEFGLRSDSKNPDAIDVSKIAVMFGGGGHKNAAGFSVSFEVAKKFQD